MALETLSPMVRALLAESNRQREQSTSKLAPEEVQSLLAPVLEGVMSGVQWVGDTLDKFGRTGRSLLFDESGAFDLGGAQLSDLLHAVPFSDTLGWTRPEDAPSEQAVRENFGLTSDTGNPWIDTPLNLATDVAIGVFTDPATLVTGPGKALTKLGVEAMQQGARVGKALSFSDEIAAAGKNALLGTSPARYADEIRAGQRGLFGLKLPFAEHPIFTVGAGSETAAKASDFLSYSPFSPSPWIRQLFDTRVRGQAPWAQRASDLLHSKTLETSAEIVDKSLAIQKRIGDIGDHYDHTIKTWLEQNPQAANELTGGVPLDQMDPGSLVRAIAELKTGSQSMQQIVQRASQLAGTQAPADVLEASRLFDEVAIAATDTKDKAFNVYRSLGGDAKELDDEFINHFPRRLSELMAGKMGKAKASKNAKEVWGAIQRNIRDIEGGTYKFNAISRDPRVTGWWDDTDPALRNTALQNAEQILATQYGLPTDRHMGFDPKGTPIVQNMAREFAGYMSKLPADVVSEGLFSRSLTTDLMDYSLNMMRRANGLQAVHGLTLAAASDDVTIGPTIQELFTDLKMTDVGVQKFVADYAKKAGLNPADVDASQIYVPHAAKIAAERMLHYNTKHKDLIGPVKLLDNVLNLYKAGLYAPWPASHIRNAISGLWQNLVTAFRGPADAAFGINEAINAMAGKGNREWLDAFKAYALHNGLQIDDALEVAKAQASDIPTGIASTLLSAGKDYTLGTAKNVLGIAKSALSPGKTAKKVFSDEGFRELLGEFGPFKGGRKLGDLVEFINRYSHFAALKQRGWTNAAAARSVKLAHFDYSPQALTPFENQVMKRLIPFYCVPEHSEALTRDGWKNCHELEFGTEILTYNIDKDCLEWQPCLEVATFEYDQELMALENTRHKILFTPNHRWPVRERGTTVKHAYGTYSYPDKHKIVTGEQLTKNQSLIVSAQYRDNSDSLLTPDQARLLGWIVTDGYHRHRGNHVEAVIYQHPKKFLLEVAAVAGGQPRKPHPATGVVCVPVENKRIKEIKPYLNKDNLITVVTRLSRDAMEAMYDAMYKADGVTSPNRSQDKFASSHPGVRGAFRVLATMLGKRVSETNDGCCISANRYLKIQHCARSHQHYKGIVWCPRTENGTWVMRQNGMITITGNTFARHNLPLQLKSLIDEPGGRAAQSIRAINTLREQKEQEGGYVPSYLSEGISIPWGSPVDGQQTFLTSSEILPFEEAFNRFPFFDNKLDVLKTAENIGSMVNPTIGTPVQMMAGRQWWSHRDIDDLYQTPTGDQNWNFLLANLPTARALSTTRMVADERKTKLQRLLNFFMGGGRFTTVDIPKWMNIESREVLQRMLEPAAGVLEGQYLFTPDPSQLTEEQITQLSILTQLQQESRRMNKERKAKEKRE